MAAKRRKAGHHGGKRTRRHDSPTSDASAASERSQRYLAAYILGRNSHLWRFSRELGIEGGDRGDQQWQELQNAATTLAGHIYPHILVALVRGGVAGHNTSSNSGTYEHEEAQCLAWLHTVVGDALDKSPQLGQWYQLGTAIGAFLTAVLRDPLVMPSNGVQRLADAAQSLAKHRNRIVVPEIDAIAARASDLNSERAIAFFDDILGREHRPDLADESRQPMILYGTFCTIDSCIEQRLRRNVSTPTPPPPKGVLPYHRLDEERPTRFAYGPLTGNQKELTRWIIGAKPGEEDPRNLRDLADTSIYFERVLRTRYNAYFTICDLYKQAKKAQEAEQEDSSDATRE